MSLPKLNSARYSTNIPSTNKQISYRPYLVKEEKILMLALESQDQQQIITAIKDVLKSCIFDKVDVDDFTMFDVEYLFLMLRSKSVGEVISIKIKCEECEVPIDVSIDLNDIVPPKVDKDMVITLSDDIGVTMKYPNIQAIGDIKEEDFTKIAGLTKLILSSIDSIYDADAVYNAKDSTPKELEDFVDTFSTEQFMKVTHFFEDLPVLKHDIEAHCRPCDHTTELELVGLQSFFT
ncbi:MAG TPA: baseplate protein [Flavobacteriales bacterium]|nr:baseplate protein [Flavobacteriales bacterium]